MGLKPAVAGNTHTTHSMHCILKSLLQHMHSKLLVFIDAGKPAYIMTFALQWLNLLCANIGLVVLCGQSLKVNIACVQVHLGMLCISSSIKH